jgi:hypothetical protein
MSEPVRRLDAYTHGHTEDSPHRPGRCHLTLQAMETDERHALLGAQSGRERVTEASSLRLSSAAVDGGLRIRKGVPKHLLSPRNTSGDPVGGRMHCCRRVEAEMNEQGTPGVVILDDAQSDIRKGSRRRSRFQPSSKCCLEVFGVE